MLRLTLVQPPHRDTFGYSMPPLGALRLAAVARDRGHAVRFVDLALLVRRGDLLPGHDLAARAAALLLEDAPELIGIGAMVPSMPAALELVEALRERAPELALLLGGQGPERVEEQVLARNPALDALAVGEAEMSFGLLLDELDARLRSSPQATTQHADDAKGARGANGASDAPPSRRAAVRAALRDTHTPGLVVAAQGTPRRNAPAPLLDPLDASPSPAWELAESPASYGAAAGGGETLFPIDLGRGCAFSCRFCTTSLFWERRVRYLSPARAADELERLAAQPGLHTIYVTHDLFTADRAHVLAVCAEIARRELALIWECRTRLDLVDRELLEALHAAGCRRILYGVESVAPARLDAMRKGGNSAALDAATVLERLQLAADCGVASILGLMVGLPGETRDDVEANLQLAADACERVPGLSLSIHWYTPTPGNLDMALGEAPLRFEPEYAADLVRGHDLPAGAPSERQRALVADDPEVFRAFRVHVPEHASAGELHRLTRHAHLLLEVLPRSLRLAARGFGTTLVDLLHELLRDVLEHTPLANTELWSEPRVLTREAVLGGAVAWLHTRLDHTPAHRAVADLLSYEHALFSTEAPTLLRLDHDPRAPEEPDVTALLLERHDDRVRARRLPAALADAYERGDPEALASLHATAPPDASSPDSSTQRPSTAHTTAHTTESAP